MAACSNTAVDLHCRAGSLSGEEGFDPCDRRSGSILALSIEPGTDSFSFLKELNNWRDPPQRSNADLTCSRLQMLPSPAEKVHKLLHLDTREQERILSSLLVSVPGLESALQSALVDTAAHSDSACGTPSSSSSDTTYNSRLLGSPPARHTGSRIPLSPSRSQPHRSPLPKFQVVQHRLSSSQPGLSDSTVAYFWTLLLSFRKALQGE